MAELETFTQQNAYLKHFLCLKLTKFWEKKCSGIMQLFYFSSLSCRKWTQESYFHIYPSYHILLCWELLKWSHEIISRQSSSNAWYCISPEANVIHHTHLEPPNSPGFTMHLWISQPFVCIKNGKSWEGYQRDYGPKEDRTSFLILISHKCSYYLIHNHGVQQLLFVEENN